jgi:hypothetical protein
MSVLTASSSVARSRKGASEAAQGPEPAVTNTEPGLCAVKAEILQGDRRNDVRGLNGLLRCGRSSPDLFIEGIGIGIGTGTGHRPDSARASILRWMAPNVRTARADRRRDCRELSADATCVAIAPATARWAE